MYLNVQQVESGLAVIAGANSAFTELIELPEKTWQQRTCRAVRIHDDNHGSRAGVYLIGGVHAREWGSSDILVHFAEKLTDAYRKGIGVTEGGASFSAEDVARIVRALDVVVFPQVNPDGRHHSMTAQPLWRKTRRPPEPGSTCADGASTGSGVDINRNYDFMWNYPAYLHPDATTVMSDDPCQATYHGPNASSEPETRNVVWLLEHVPGIRYFVDIHSFGEWIVYPWGDDHNQSDAPQENFREPAWNGKRGLPNDEYGENITVPDGAHHIDLASAMFTGIKDAHGREYEVSQSALLNTSKTGLLYVTTGTADDYAFARHLSDPGKPKVYGYTIEWGPSTTTLASRSTRTTRTWCRSSRRSRRGCCRSAWRSPSGRW